MINWLLAITPPLSLLLATILLLRPWVLTRFGARFQYGLWLTVPLLLTLLSLPMGLPATADMETYRVTLGKLSQQASEIDWLGGGYWLGLLTCLGLLLHSLIQLAKLLRSASPLPAQGRLKLLSSNDTLSPFVLGFLSPTVVLPSGFMHKTPNEEKNLILAHELGHWQRGDLHLNLLAISLVCLCWFNPLCLLAYRSFRQDQELACDAAVTAGLTQAERIAYGRALIGHATQVARNWQPLSHHYGDKHTMKQRLMQLKRQHGFSRSSLLLPLVLTAGLGIWSQAPAIAGEKQAAPHPVMRVEPKYPAQAAKDLVEGYIQARFDIGQDGRVSNVTIFKSEPAGVFDQAAIAALNKWQYEPKATKAMEVQLDFRMGPPGASDKRADNDERERIDVLPHSDKQH
ncbi:M56 family metallopeptidase [Shewanella cyperi]|uniref:M56 family metallopeptidase n=1 Tax=Shewanella cyperi TaxID=2814292 RepID=UPI001A945A04|nr:M56 family metallopeptidase [Shewanella cyperi]QSX40623.1 TonB family protein [Shewanella cyperi]